MSEIRSRCPATACTGTVHYSLADGQRLAFEKGGPALVGECDLCHRKWHLRDGAQLPAPDNPEDAPDE